MNLANKLTVGRLVMAGIFFACMMLGETPQHWPDGWQLSRQLLLNIAFVLFIVAGLTDVLDGWVARTFDMTSDFGRIADPFCDKVMTCGALIFLATIPVWPGKPEVFIPAWVVVLVVAREFLVNGLRGFIEARGHEFGALIAGKFKMFTQCFAIGSALYVTANLSDTPWALTLTRVSVWVMLATTLLSGWVYLREGRKILLEVS